MIWSDVGCTLTVIGGLGFIIGGASQVLPALEAYMAKKKHEQEERDEEVEGNLFSHAEAAARASDPESSQEAAAKVNAASLEWRALELLRRHAAGLTTKEMTKLDGKERDSFSPRMQPLLRKGFVEMTGEKRALDGVGVRCIVWRLTDKGRALFDQPQESAA